MKASAESNFNNMKKKQLWFILFIIVAIASIFAIVSFNKSFSFNQFMGFVKSANPLWVGLSLLSMFLFILFEGIALQYLVKPFGYKAKLSSAFAYSSADIYFSAITPSATGGQPASAYFMHKDGISLPVTAVAMFCLLMMYSISLIVINIISFILCPGLIFKLDFLAKIFIIVGFLSQVGLVIFFHLLLFNERLLYKLGQFLVNFLTKIRVIKDKNSANGKLNDIINKYTASAKLLKGKRKILFNVLIFTLLQRIAQIGVVVFVFIATKGNIGNALAIWTIQGFAITGSYCIPIPGAIGVSDYLMLNGFKTLMSEAAAVNLELMGRGISFYCCIILCGVTILIKYLLQKRSSRK